MGRGRRRRLLGAAVQVARRHACGGVARGAGRGGGLAGAATPFWLYRLAVGLIAQSGIIALDRLGAPPDAVGAYAASVTLVAPLLVVSTATSRAYSRDVAILLDRRRRRRIGRSHPAADSVAGSVPDRRDSRRVHVHAAALVAVPAGIRRGGALADPHPDADGGVHDDLRAGADDPEVPRPERFGPADLGAAAVGQIALLALLVPPFGAHRGGDRRIRDRTGDVRPLRGAGVG